MDLIDPCRKIVIELRYAPDLAFYGKMDSTAIQFSDSFPDWERSPLTVEVRTKKKHRRIFIANRRCFFESDLRAQASNTEYEAARGFLERICTSALSTLDFRVGNPPKYRNRPGETETSTLILALTKH